MIRSQPASSVSTSALVVFMAVALLTASSVAFAQEAETSVEGEAAAPAASFGEVVDVRVVNVNVWVEGRNGELSVGLGKDAFELKVDGKPVEITNFHSEVDGTVRESIQAVERPGRPRRDDSFVPLDEIQTDPQRRAHVIIYVDNTRLRQANRRRAFNAVREVLGKLDRDDLVSVVSLGGSLVFHSDFLFDREAVREILSELEREPGPPETSEIERRQIFSELARGISGGILARTEINSDSMLMRIRGYATEEYQRSVQSLRALDQVVNSLAGAPGRKVLLYVGEGIPTRPGEGMHVEFVNRFGDFADMSVGLPHVDYNRDYERDIGNYDLEPVLEQVADHANSSGVVLYAVDAEASHSGIIRSAQVEQGAWSESLTVIDENFRAPLEFATQATGGKLLRSSGKLADQLANVVRDFDTFYSIGFFQPKDWKPGSEHQIKIDVKGRGYRVRHPESVRVPMVGETEARAMIAALMYQTVDNPLAIKANAGTEVPRDDGTAALPVLVEMPVKNLATVPQETTQAISLTLYVATKDAAGNPGAVQRIPFHLDIPNDKIEEARTQSAHYSLPVVLRKGDLQVAVGVRDDVSGAFSVVRIDVAQYSQSL